MRSKFYVGLNGGNRLIFKSLNTPTKESHGDLFKAVIGPFRTGKGAKYMAQYGAGNPHCQTVAEAEKLAKRCIAL